MMGGERALWQSKDLAIPPKYRKHKQIGMLPKFDSIYILHGTMAMRVYLLLANQEHVLECFSLGAR